MSNSACFSGRLVIADRGASAPQPFWKMKKMNFVALVPALLLGLMSTSASASTEALELERQIAKDATTVQVFEKTSVIGGLRYCKLEALAQTVEESMHRAMGRTISLDKRSTDKVASFMHATDRTTHLSMGVRFGLKLAMLTPEMEQAICMAMVDNADRLLLAATSPRFR